MVDAELGPGQDQVLYAGLKDSHLQSRCTSGATTITKSLYSYVL